MHQVRSLYSCLLLTAQNGQATGTGRQLPTDPKLLKGNVLPAFREMLSVAIQRLLLGNVGLPGGGMGVVPGLFVRLLTNWKRYTHPQRLGRQLTHWASHSYSSPQFGQLVGLSFVGYSTPVWQSSHGNFGVGGAGFGLCFMAPKSRE